MGEILALTTSGASMHRGRPVYFAQTSSPDQNPDSYMERGFYPRNARSPGLWIRYFTSRDFTREGA